MCTSSSFFTLRVPRILEGTYMPISVIASLTFFLHSPIFSFYVILKWLSRCAVSNSLDRVHYISYRSYRSTSDFFFVLTSEFFLPCNPSRVSYSFHSSPYLIIWFSLSRKIFSSLLTDSFAAFLLRALRLERGLLLSLRASSLTSLTSSSTLMDTLESSSLLRVLIVGR